VELQHNVADLKKRLSTQEAKAADARERLAEASSQHAAAAAALQSEIESLSDSLEDLRIQLANKSHLHETSLNQINELTTRLDEQAAVIDELTSELCDAETIRDNNQSLQQRVDDLMERLKEVNAELDDSLEANSKVQDRIREAERQLHEQAATIRQLRRKRGSIADLTEDPSDENDRRAA
jgi:chromosome segregation ATPase